MSIWSGSFRLFGVEVKCHTLSDGQRIIEAESMHRLIAVLETDVSDWGPDGDDILGFARWRSGQDP